MLLLFKNKTEKGFGVTLHNLIKSVISGIAGRKLELADLDEKALVASMLLDYENKNHVDCFALLRVVNINKVSAAALMERINEEGLELFSELAACLQQTLTYFHNNGIAHGNLSLDKFYFYCLDSSQLLGAKIGCSLMGFDKKRSVFLSERNRGLFESGHIDPRCSSSTFSEEYNQRKQDDLKGLEVIMETAEDQQSSIHSNRRSSLVVMSYF